MRTKMFYLATVAQGAAGGVAATRTRKTTATSAREAWAAKPPSSLTTAPGSGYRSSSGSTSTSSSIGQATRAQERVAEGGHSGGGSPSQSGVVFYCGFGVLLALFLLYHITTRYCRKPRLGARGRARVEGGQRPLGGSNAVPHQRGRGEREGGAVAEEAGAAPIADQGLAITTN